jgi:hypothetical protein
MGGNYIVSRVKIIFRNITNMLAPVVCVFLLFILNPVLNRALLCVEQRFLC